MRSMRLVSTRVLSEATMIVNTTRITVQPDKRTEFLQTVGPLLDPLKKAKGCRTLDFYLDTMDENSTLLISEWDTEKDLNNYLESNDFAVLRGAITVLSVSSIDSKANVTSHLCKP
jgi:quinol monooxygenase YgiN